MKLKVIFGLRVEQEETPEAIEVWDEYAIEGNPDGYEEQLAIARANKEFLSIVVAEFWVEEKKIMDALSKPLRLEGTLKSTERIK